jgi:hypothetical protein
MAGGAHRPVRDFPSSLSCSQAPQQHVARVCICCWQYFGLWLSRQLLLLALSPDPVHNPLSGVHPAPGASPGTDFLSLSLSTMGTQALLETWCCSNFLGPEPPARSQGMGCRGAPAFCPCLSVASAAASESPTGHAPPGASTLPAGPGKWLYHIVIFQSGEL